ncbi:MAG: Holliday junction branch migration DNA helicase RuvB [candidate division NC10 bacterium]|jgi:Holliday junction DNA helicase RuvB|nr:Holliday junction branch migration DNA helicase RuvB [candidate division NC10 bacterium]
MTDRIVTRSPLEEDQQWEPTIRPKVWEEYVGQDKVKENLRVFIEAARARGEPLDHVLFHGPPGLGKTTLAYLIATELQVGVRATSGPVLERPGDVAAILTNLEDRDVLFVDEIHRMNRVVEEILYPAMEDFQLDLVIGQGPHARTIKLDLPRFTLVGATTRAGLLTAPFRNRFGVIHRLDYYSDEEIHRIILRSARVLGVEISPEGAGELAGRSRGTPRVANRILRRVRDFAQVLGDGVITQELAHVALERLEVDERGLDDMDRRILQTLIGKFDGGPVGLETLAVAVGEEKDTIEDIYEPFLIQSGFLARTPRGRTATRLAFDHFGFTPKARPQEELL